MKKELFIEKLNGHDTTGMIGKISKVVGDTVQIGESLFTIESGKGALTFKSTEEGILLSFSVEEGQMVTKGQVVAVVEAVEHSASNENSKSATLKGASAAYSFGFSKPQKRTVDVDLAIVGGGPGGYVAAIRAAQAGLKVAIVEEDRMGGTCLNYGCIPTKAMASSVSVLNDIRRASDFGFEIPKVDINFDKLMDRKNKVVDQLVGGIEHLMSAHNIEFIKGKAQVQQKNQLAVNDKLQELTLNYKILILAMGSKPCAIPIEGHDLPDILTSKELLSLKEVPKSLTIIGGGVIGMEFAFIYRALGAEVTVVEYLPQILNMLDADVADVVRNSAIEKGIQIYEGACAASIKDTLNGLKILEIQIGETSHFIVSEKVAMAVGRKANLDSLNLELLEVALNERQNGIEVNGFMQTSNKNVYAIGDVTNIIQLAHVASHQAFIAVDHICGSQTQINYDYIPSAIFTNPEVGHVGMTEKEAVVSEIDYLVSAFPFMANGKALAMGESEGFVKLIARKDDRVIIGGTIVGVHATDLLATIGNLVSSQTTIDEASHVIYAHPTTSESIHEAILMLDKRGVHFA